MKSAMKPVMGKAGMKTTFAKVPKGGKQSSKGVNNGKKVPFNVSQFHAQKGNVTN